MFKKLILKVYYIRWWLFIIAIYGFAAFLVFRGIGG